MTKAHAKLPRGIVLEVIGLIALAFIPRTIFGIILQQSAVASCEIIPGRRLDRQAEAEGRLLDRTHDDTCGEIETCTTNLPTVANHDRATGAILVDQTFTILAITAIIGILHTNGKTPVESVVHITTHVEVIVGNPAAMGTIEGVFIGINSIDGGIVGIEHQRVGVHIISLAVRPRTILALIADNLTLIIEIKLINTLFGLIVGQTILGSAPE